LALPRALDAGLAALRAGERRASVVRAAMRAVLAAEVLVEPDYVEVVDASTLEVRELLQGEVRLLVAARVGAVRLIDNDGTRLGAPAPSGRELVLTDTVKEC
jgi:pantoate--beta-alanine ligase